MTDQLIERGRMRFEPGYWQGLRQPAVLLALRLTRQEVSTAAISRFDDLVAAVRAPQASGPVERFLDAAVLAHPVLGRLCRMALSVLETMGMPVMGGVSAIKPEPQRAGHWIVGLPALAEEVHAPQAAFDLACRLMNDLTAGKEVRADAVMGEVKKLRNEFGPLAPAGINTLRFLQAAHEMDIPWQHVASNVYQFGWGGRSRWLDSSFTDETSTISASLARNKVACAKVLRDAGLPVPRHLLVTDAAQAVKAAQALGYPVVVKPANLDGGLGVMAGLRDAGGVKSAFAVTAKLSKLILVEQFIEGNDYRIRVCKNEVIGAVIRKAAAVVGDGVKSVRALIDSVNRERAKRTQPLDPDVEQGSKPIVADGEVLQWLAAQGFTLDSVIAPGQQVRLRGAANVSLGGTTWDVTSQAHPDNLALALQAVAALRLDVAGVDVLLPDIARSWKETGGAVCEVNGQPQFSSGPAHRRVLERLVHHEGRIPVVGVMQACVGAGSLEGLAQRLAREGVRVRVMSTLRECQQAMRSVETDVLIWHMNGRPSAVEGAPVDRLDVLIQSRSPSSGRAPAFLRVDDCWELSESPDLEAVIERLFKYLHEVCSDRERERADP